MKILIVTNMYPSDGDLSWRGGFVKDQIDSLHKVSNNVTIDIFHIKGKVSNGSNLNYIKLLPQLMFKLIFGKYDVVHCHHAFCALLCFPWIFRYIYTVHEGELNNTSVRSLLIKVSIFLSKVPIFVSSKEFKISAHKNKIFLPCGVDFSEFRPVDNKEKLRHDLGMPLDKKIILFPADPSRPEKNALILKEVEKNSDLEKLLFIYGGNIPKNDMHKWMAAVDIVISIGKYESDGMVIKESLSCGTPVISTRVGNSEVYVNNNCGLIVEPSPSEVYKSILQIINNYDSFSNGRQGLKLLGQDMKSVATHLYGVYDSSNKK